MGKWVYILADVLTTHLVYVISWIINKPLWSIWYPKKVVEQLSCLKKLIYSLG